MSGFAASTGEPDGPPTLPPFGLADGITALATAFAVMSRPARTSTAGQGQVIDMAIIEPILTMLGPRSRRDQQRHVQPRLGNRSSNNAPRNVYQHRRRPLGRGVDEFADHRRARRAPGRSGGPGRPAVVRDRAERAEHADELDEAVGGWIARAHASEVVDEFEQAEAAVAPIYTAEDIVADPQLQALGTIRRVEDPDLGELAMQGPLFRLSEGDAPTRWTGRAPGADTSGADRARLRSRRDRGSGRSGAAPEPGCRPEP